MVLACLMLTACAGTPDNCELLIGICDLKEPDDHKVAMLTTC